MNSLLEKLAQLEAKLEQIEDSNRQDRETILNIESRIKDRDIQAQSLHEQIKFYKGLLDEFQEEKAKAQEALSTLYIAHKTGGATDSDYKTYADSVGIELPEEAEEDPESGG
jgi:chromosome segregation ATPase